MKKCHHLHLSSFLGVEFFQTAGPIRPLPQDGDVRTTLPHLDFFLWTPMDIICIPDNYIQICSERGQATGTESWLVVPYKLFKPRFEAS